MYKRGRTDTNQTEIVKALRAIGASVAVTSSLGKGFPDLVVGWQGRNYLLEVKDGTLPPSRTRLTPDEQRWHDSWRGHVVTIYSADDALEVLGT